MDAVHESAGLDSALWRIYNRPKRPEPWSIGGNLPWDDPDFSRRMLDQHLDESHSAASRQAAERGIVLEWVWDRLELAPGCRLLDVTCGPGLYAVELARRGVYVTGVDFAPAAIEYAEELATREGVAERCRFLLQDVREVAIGPARRIAAMLLYGQFAVFTRGDAQKLLTTVAEALGPGGRLIVELLDLEAIDKSDRTWWCTGDSGLWGDTPFLHLGERQWHPEDNISVERFCTVHLETGAMDQIYLCDQGYEVAEMSAMMERAGFDRVDVYPGWDGLPLHDAGMYVTYVAQKS